MTSPLDPSLDPDRFDASKAVPAQAGPLDPAGDPDRFHEGRSPTLPEMLGEGAYEDERNNLEWLYGLLAVVAFLAIMTGAIYLH